MIGVKVPELRFPEFSDEWKSQKLKNISKELNRTSEKSDVEILTISAGKGFITQKERWNKVIAGNSLKKYTFMKKNEFSYNRGNSKTFPYGCTYRLKDHEYALVPNVYRSFSVEGQNPLFYEQFFIGGHIDRQLNKLISSSARMDGLLNISKKDFFDVDVSVPTLQEQEKIGTFLSKVDEKIEKLEKKQELWETYKKGIMQQIFSQKLKFKDENGEDYPDWKEEKIGNILNVKYGKDYKHLDNGQFPVFGTGGVMTYVNEFLYDKPSVLIGRKGTINKPIFINEPFWTVDTLFYTEIYGSNPKFTFYLVSIINWLKYNEASGVPSLSAENIKKIPIKLPSFNEQTKIANFLSSIEGKIEKIEKELKINKEFKKGLLQQMFC